MPPNVFKSLKKAVFYTKTNRDFDEYRYIAVDKDGEIFAYISEPYRNEFEWFPIQPEQQKFIGWYKGKVFWKNSLSKMSRTGCMRNVNNTMETPAKDS